MSGRSPIAFLAGEPARFLAALSLLQLAACTPPIRQFDLKDQPVTCAQANRYAYDALKAMGYTITSFKPASAGTPGVVKGTRDEDKRTSSVTVAIICAGAGPTLDASEDGKWLGQLDFKRGFYLAYTGIVAQQRALDEAAKQQAALPVTQRRQQGFEVLVKQVKGLDAKMDFPGVDFAAAGVLPVKVVIHNWTERRYQLDPDDIVLVRGDGERIHPMTVAAVMQRVRQAPTPSPDTAPVAMDSFALPQQLESRRLTVTKMGPDASAHGYLFYPLDDYKRARVLVTESESEETEGFMVEF
jgi:hypothetical protein